MTFLYHTYEYIPEDKIKSAVVMVYEIFGFTDHIHNFANSLANKGYLYLPDIFSRLEKSVI